MPLVDDQVAVNVVPRACLVDVAQNPEVTALEAEIRCRNYIGIIGGELNSGIPRHIEVEVELTPEHVQAVVELEGAVAVILQGILLNVHNPAADLGQLTVTLRAWVQNTQSPVQRALRVLVTRRIHHDFPTALQTLPEAPANVVGRVPKLGGSGQTRVADDRKVVLATVRVRPGVPPVDVEHLTGLREHDHRPVVIAGDVIHQAEARPEVPIVAAVGHFVMEEGDAAIANPVTRVVRGSETQDSVAHLKRPIELLA